MAKSLAPELYIYLWRTGLYTQRNPLVTPIASQGLNIVTRNDALCDGLNMEVSNLNTLIRRPAFTRYCSTHLGATDSPMNFYTMRTISGTINTLVDTQSGVFVFKPTSLLPLSEKIVPTAKTRFQKVADTLYFCDGTSAYKWVGGGVNYLQHTQSFDTGWTLGTGVTVTDNADVDPTGDYTASFISYDSSAGSSDVRVQQIATADATHPPLGENVTASIYLRINGPVPLPRPPKPGPRPFIPIGSNTPNFTLSNGVQSTEIVLTTQWQRFSVSGPSDGIQAGQLSLSSAFGENINFNILAWGAQFELSDTMSPYEPVLGSAPNGPLNVSNWGIYPSLTAPDLSFIANGTLTPQAGYKYVYSGKNNSTGHVSSASPSSADTGPLFNNVITETASTAVITFVGVASGTVTITCANNFKPGQLVTISDVTTATWLNGTVFAVVTSSPTAFTALTGHGTYANTADNGKATMALTIPTTPYQYTVLETSTFLGDLGVTFADTHIVLTVTSGTPAAGEYSVSAVGMYTFAAADVARPISIQYSYSLALSVGLNIQVSGLGFLDTQVDKIDIYRTADGGSLFYYLATVDNPVDGGTWVYTDSTQDLNLNNFIQAPINNINDPPPLHVNNVAFHDGRMWVSVNNYVYFGAGGDALVGVPEECFPPANVFVFPGTVTALISTSQGILVSTIDSIYLISGTSTLSYSSQVWLNNFGVMNPWCVAQDGDLFYIYTSRSQLYEISGSMSEIGMPIGDILRADFNPNSTCLTLHRDGSDNGLFISNGTTDIYKYAVTSQCWSPVSRPIGGVNVISSLETSAGKWTMVAGRATGGGYVLKRDVTSYTDDGGNYLASATIGSIILAPPRETINIESVLVERAPVGSSHEVFVLLNEVAGTYVVVPLTANDPWRLPPSTSIIATRHDFLGSPTPLPSEVRHLRVKISFSTDAVANEVYGVALKPVGP